MSLLSRMSVAARAVRRRVLTRANAAVFVTVLGVVVVAAGLAGWSREFALVFVGVFLMAYGLLFIDIDAPLRRGRR